MIRQHRSIRFILSFLVALAPSRFAAADFWKDPFEKLGSYLPESLQIHGFLSQGYLRTSDNNFFGKTTNMGSLDFRELGINGSWRPLKDLQLSLQVLSRKAGQTDDGYVRIDFGSLSYTAFSTAEDVWGIRLGRVINPYGLYNDTRDMPFTRPSILLPQSIYFDVNRQLALSSDGGQLFGEHHAEWGDLYFQFNVGYPRTTDPELKYNLQDLSQLGRVSGALSFMGRLMYELDGGRVRLGVTGSNVNLNLTRFPFSPLSSGSNRFTPIIFSAQYNGEDWSLTSEYQLRGISFAGFGPQFPLPNRDYWGQGFYVQGTYRFAPDWEAFLRYDDLCVQQSDCNGKQWEATTGLPAHGQFAKDISTGIRWDLTPSVMLRAEYHYVNGTGWISLLENKQGPQQHWHLYGLSVSFRF